MDAKRVARLEEIARVARECRAAQRLYFRQRTREHLELALMRERRLDIELETLEDLEAADERAARRAAP